MLIKTDTDNGGFEGVLDPKLRNLAIALADKLDDEAVSQLWYAYTDKGFLSRWQQIRDSGEYQKGGEVHRKVLEVPVVVNDFLVKYFGDPKWQTNKKLWKHEFVRPWLVVNL